MTTCIYDHTAAEGVAQLPGLQELQTQPFVELAKWPEEVPNDSVVFVHAGNEDGRGAAAWRRIASTEARKFVIFVSSNPSGLNGSGEAWFSCRRAFSEVLQSGDVAHIVAAFRDGKDPTQFFDNVDVSAQFAFRLLCEAWQFCGGEKCRDCQGIVIHAPLTLDDWLAPFGKSAVTDIPHVASMIGTTKAPATAVLNAANGQGNLTTAIQAFLDASRNSVANR